MNENDVNSTASDFPLHDVTERVHQLLRSLQQHGAAGFDIEDQVDEIMALLFEQLNRRDLFSDPLFEKTEKMTFQCFYILTSIHNSRVLYILKMGILSRDPERIVLTLKVFMKVIEVVPQSNDVKREVVQATITVLQQHFQPLTDHQVVSGFLTQSPRASPIQVQHILLDFIVVLIQQDYLLPPEGHNLLIELMQMNFNNQSVRWDMKKKCSDVLNKVSLAKLITVVCHPENHTIFVPMSKRLIKRCAMEKRLGHLPYLSRYQLMPTRFMSPQELLVNLLLLAKNSSGQAKLRINSLLLLSFVQPLTSLDPAINSGYIDVCSRTIPQLVKILRENEITLNEKEWDKELLEFSGKYLTAVHDDDWLEQLLQVLLEKIKGSNSGLSDKAFLYKLVGSALSIVNSRQLVESMVISLLQTSHKDLDERKGIAEALSATSQSHLEVVLLQLKTYTAALLEVNTSPILEMAQDLQQREWVLVCDTIYCSLSKITKKIKGDIAKYVNDILALTSDNYNNAIVEKDTTLKVSYLKALKKLTTALRTQLVDRNTKFPHAQELVILMMRFLEEEPVVSMSSPIRLKAIGVITDIWSFKEENQDDEAVLYTCCQNVFSLPATYRLFGEGYQHLEDNADLFRNTVRSLLNLLKKTVAEKPWRIECFLTVLYDSLNSRSNAEWEHGMWWASNILGYMADTDCLTTEIAFINFGHLLKLLTMGCHNKASDIFSLSSRALNHLYSILVQQKSKGVPVGLKFVFPELCRGSNEKYMTKMNVHQSYQATTIGKVFAEFFNNTQLLIFLKEVLEDQKGSEVEVSLTALQLMNGILTEWYRDPMQSEHFTEVSLACLLIRDIRKKELRVTLESIRCLKIIMSQASKMEIKDNFGNISKELCLLMLEARREVRNEATDFLFIILKRIYAFCLENSLKKEIQTFILPLLLNFQEEKICTKVCAVTLGKWAQVMGYSSLTRKLEHGKVYDPKQKKTIEETLRHLISRKPQWLGRLLSENFSLIHSPDPFVRTTAYKFIGIILKVLPEVSEKDAEVIETDENEPLARRSLLIPPEDASIS